MTTARIETNTTDFTTCLFRLANMSKSSIMCIEIAQVKSKKITHKQYWLINPECEFDLSNQAQREFLTKKDIDGYPTFTEVWDEIKPYFENQIIITQNTSHVLNMLFYTLDKHQLHYPNFIFYDSKNIIGKTLLADSSEESEMIRFYKKNNITHTPTSIDAPYDPMMFAEKIGLNYKYGLGNFAVIIAESMIKVFNNTGIQSFNELECILQCQHGFTKGNDYCSYKPHANTSTQKINYKDVQKQATENDKITKCAYTGKKILFTGKMNNLTRDEIVHLAAEFGIIPQENVTKSLNIVVVGENPGPSKIDKIAKINIDGDCIAIMNESDFLRSINSK